MQNKNIKKMWLFLIYIILLNQVLLFGIDNYDFTWEFNKKPENSFCINSSFYQVKKAEQACFTPDVPGTYEIKLTINFNGESIDKNFIYNISNNDIFKKVIIKPDLNEIIGSKMENLTNRDLSDNNIDDQQNISEKVSKITETISDSSESDNISTSFDIDESDNVIEQEQNTGFNWQSIPSEDTINQEESNENVIDIDKKPLDEIASEKKNHEISEYIIEKINNNMIELLSNSFKMGDTFDDGDDDEQPVYLNEVDNYTINKYEVSQIEWKAVMGDDGVKDENFPITNISWYDAIEFCNKLSKAAGLNPCYTINGKNVICDFTSNGFRLPTESEWEYAAKRSGKSEYHNYSGSENIEDVAWYWKNSGDSRLSGKYSFNKIKENNCRVQKSGTKSANSFGLYDMTGNVSEWCWDDYGEYPGKNYKSNSDSRKSKVIRGGNFRENENRCRTVCRDASNPNYERNYVGFRICRTN